MTKSTIGASPDFSPDTKQPDEKPVPLAKAQAWPGVSRVELLQIATNAFCRYNPPGYGWDSRALEAACKAYHKAAIPEQPVDTSDIAHKLEYAFPQISLSALSDIIEYFRPYLRQPERESDALKEENRVLREALNPHESVKGLYPLILYFDNRAEADEFTDLVQQAKPGMRSYKI